MLKRIFTLLFVLSAATLQGQTLELSPVYVTESLQRQESRTSGRNSFILTGSDIRKLPVQSLDDLLRLVPGIEVQQRGPQGSQSDLVIRGGTFQQVLVVIDGVRLNDPLTGHFSGYIPVLLDDIERIEVIKGAAASVFGPDAVGGVIHITTRSGMKEKQQPKALHAAVMGGSYGGLQASAWGSLQGKGHYLSGGYQWNRADGAPLRGTRGFFDNRLGTLNWKKSFAGGWNFAMAVARDSRDFNAQNFYTAFLSDTAREQVRTHRGQLTLFRHKEGFSYGLLLGAKELRDVYGFRPSSAPNRNNSQLYTADVRARLRLEKLKGQLSGGLQVFRKAIRSNDRGNHGHWHTGIYAQLRHTVAGKLTLTESIRSDWDDQYGWVLLPLFNAAYVRPRITLRGSIGKGIRDADFTERYNNAAKPVVTGGNIGNPYLKPERSMNVELGADWTVTDLLQVRTTVFQRSQKDLIDWVPLPYAMIPYRQNLLPNGTYALASNIEGVRTRGVELDLGGAVVASGTKGLKWSSGMTWLQTTTRDGKPTSFYLSSHARWIWNTSIQWYGSWGSVSSGTVYKVRNAQKPANAIVPVDASCFTWNLRIEKYLLDHRMGLRLQVDNVTNTRYADLLGALMPGRWWQSGLWVRL